MTELKKNETMVSHAWWELKISFNNSLERNDLNKLYMNIFNCVVMHKVYEKDDNKIWIFIEIYCKQTLLNEYR